MAEVKPFHAVRYGDAAGPLEQLVAPPYDVISREQREELRAKSQYNVVHLTLPDDEAATQGLTVRQLVEKHVSDPKCAVCHERIDPYGFSLDAFDAIGRHREKDLGGRPVEPLLLGRQRDCARRRQRDGDDDDPLPPHKRPQRP